MELAAMQRLAQKVVAERSQAIALRRGASILDAQDMRVERVGGRSMNRDGAAAERTISKVTVQGGIDLDIELGDRFTLDGNLYNVLFIHPNRDILVQAEAEIVE